MHGLNSVAIPRAAGAFMAVVLAAGLAGGVGYFLCGQLGAFLAELPKDSDRIQRALEDIQEPMSKLERNASSMTTSSIRGKQPVPVRIEEEPIFPRIVSDNGAAIGQDSPGDRLYSFLDLFHADVEGTLPFGDCRAVPNTGPLPTEQLLRSLQ